jgi:thioredoxin-related protein
MKLTIITGILVLAIGIHLPAKAQEKPAAINWMSFEKAIETNQNTKKHKKKIFIDVFTDWCGWCTRMDQVTFKDSAVIAIMNKYFLAVKLNAERKDTVIYNGKTFVNPNPQSSRSTHQLAANLLQGQLSYPTFVILNEKEELIQTLKGYRVPTEIVPILKFFAENIYLTKTWADYQKELTTPKNP